MSERDEFEAWYMAPNGVRNTGLEEPLARDGSNYYWPSTQDSWDVWQAARAPQAVPALTDGYGSTDFGYTFAGIDLEDGDKRLMAVLVQAFGTDHPAVTDLVALIWRSRAAPQPFQEQQSRQKYQD